MNANIPTPRADKIIDGLIANGSAKGVYHNPFVWEEHQEAIRDLERELAQAQAEKERLKAELADAMIRPDWMVEENERLNKQFSEYENQNVKLAEAVDVIRSAQAALNVSGNTKDSAEIYNRGHYAIRNFMREYPELFGGADR